MKSKKSLYILLSVVVVIWGLIIYRVVCNISFSADLPQNVDNGLLPANEQLKLDSFSIQANYRDPFLDKQQKTQDSKPAVKNNVEKKTIIKEPIATIKKPNYNIIYKGLISNKASQSSLAMLNIDGKEKLMRDKESFKDLTILKIGKDSILIGTPNGNFYVKRK